MIAKCGARLTGGAGAAHCLGSGARSRSGGCLLNAYKGENVFSRALRARLIPVCLGLGFAIAMVGAASASAAPLYVSNTAPVVVGGRSCAQPDYNSIQAAITAGGAGANISVCPGTYTEQLAITKAARLSAASGAGTATVAMPAAPKESTTKCDTLEGLEASRCRFDLRARRHRHARRASTSKRLCRSKRLRRTASTASSSGKAR